MNNFIILTPTFNDWKSLSKLLSEIDKNIANLKVSFKTLIINDASTLKPKLNLKNVKRLKKIKIVTLKKNLGSQKSICLGLKYLQKKKTKAIITIIDSDGEDERSRQKRNCRLRKSHRNAGPFDESWTADRGISRSRDGVYHGCCFTDGSEFKKNCCRMKDSNSRF